MEYLRGWRALRQDPEWLGKLGVATVIVLLGSCIPIIGQVVLAGWSSLMLRRAVSGQDSPLPRLDFDFDYLMKLLNVGFKGFLARMLWSLPLIAFSGMLGCCMYVGLIGAAAGASSSGGGEEVGIAMLCMMAGFGLFFPVVVIAASLPIHIAAMRAELTDDLNSAMRFKEVLGTTKLMMKELIVGQIVLTLIGMGVGMVGVLTLYLGLFPGIVVMQIITTYWLAELYKAYLQKGGEPLKVGPLDVPGAEPYPGQHPPGPLSF